MAFDYRQEYHRYKLYYLKLQSLAGEPAAQASLTILASLFAVTLLAIFAIKPTLTTIASLTKEIEDKQKISLQLETKTKALQSAEANYSQIVSQIPLIETVLPTKPDFARLEQEIEYLAWQHQVIISSGNFGGFVVAGKETEKKDDSKRPTESAGTKDISFNLIAGGSYQNLKEFIQDLENLDRVIVIGSINFTKESEIKGVELQVSIMGKAFYKPKGAS
ncbi:hypothetical protein A2160_01385 [Candidatus Beckwithbacteria bacterium RBG_13_42_9]|uniref:Type 4 fimbrial biogenesis protein PilO n=1 Tax=Candidatus Beckwithbacteria bacterium RBG_13_42_9 TaxID=1797457 RepID=A0A1F5E4H6_9BACT|nr:MAG: hypothetical protein A2160_01385 [Candidatus Beckwithbacteria bacterium RBG_13_42_9]